MSVYFIGIYWVPSGHVCHLCQILYKAGRIQFICHPVLKALFYILLFLWIHCSGAACPQGQGWGSAGQKAGIPHSLPSIVTDRGFFLTLEMDHLWALFAVSSSPIRGSSPLLPSSVSAFGNPVHPSKPSSPPALTTKASWTNLPIFLWTTQAAVSAGDALNVWEPAGHGHWRVGVCPSCK